MKLRSLIFVAVLITGSIGIFASGSAVEDNPVYSPELAYFQQRLRAAGISHVAIEKAELLYAPGAWDGASPHTIEANDRTHRFSSLFVENDPRRASPPNTISYLVDQSDGSALGFDHSGVIVSLPNAVTEPEIDAAMAAWDDFQCNGPNVTKVSDPGEDPDWLDNIFAGTPVNLAVPYADVVHAGWLPATFFDRIIPNGGSFLLGFTVTFTFLNPDGTRSDIDRDGRPDAAWREIYYNRRWTWGTGDNPRNDDIQTVAIHESGHAFGLGHFGKVTHKDGLYHYSPRAAMNAVIPLEDRQIYGTDIASFCSIWANRR